MIEILLESALLVSEISEGLSTRVTSKGSWDEEIDDNNILSSLASRETSLPVNSSTTLSDSNFILVKPKVLVFYTKKYCGTKSGSRIRKTTKNVFSGFLVCWPSIYIYIYIYLYIYVCIYIHQEKINLITFLRCPNT